MIIKARLNRFFLNNRFLIMNIKNISNISDIKLNDTKNERVRVRFAPSPTGQLHIG